MKNNPKATIAICSLISNDTFRSLSELLNSLKKQEGIEHFKFSLILDNANNSIRKIIPSEIHQKTNLNLSHSRRGIAIAREIAIQSAEGDYILFIDDDCVPKNGWAKKLITFMENNINLIGTGGQTLPCQTQTLAEKYVDFEKAQRTPLINKNGKIICISTVNSIFNLKKLRDIEFITSAYQTIYSLGYFPGFEDFDLSYRIANHYGEKTLGYCEDAIVFHRNRPTVRARLKQYKYYGIGASFWALANDFPMDKYEAGYPLPERVVWFNVVKLIFRNTKHHIKKFFIYRKHFSLFISLAFTMIGFLENLFYYLGAHKMYSKFISFQKQGKI